MKTLAALLALLAVSCGVPINVSAIYRDADSGAKVALGYSSKGGLTIEATK